MFRVSDKPTPARLPRQTEPPMTVLDLAFAIGTLVTLGLAGIAALPWRVLRGAP